MEKPPPVPLVSRSLPRRLHGRSKSAGASMLKPFELQPFVAPSPHRSGAVAEEAHVDDECEEPETHLREHLEYEMRMREGSTKLLAVAQHPEVVLEGAKSLLVSEQRMHYFRKELQRRKSGESLKALWALPPECDAVQLSSTSATTHSNEENPATTACSSVHDQRPCRAVLSVSEMRIPLMWPEKEHFKNRGFLRRFAVFCLVRIGAQIRDTVLVPCVDRSSTDVSFQDALVFKRVPPDFECVVEIYAHNLDDFEAISTPSLIRRKLGHVTASVGRTMGRRMAAGVRDEMMMTGGDGAMMVGGGAAGNAPEFALVARTTLRLDDVDEYGRAFDLEIVAGDSTRDKLPLFGQISCRLAARPSLKVKTVMEGQLRIKDALIHCGGSGVSKEEWTPYWCRLCDRQVSCWSSRGEAESGRPCYMQMPVSAYRTQLSLHSTASSSSSACSQGSPSSSGASSAILVLRDGVDAHEFHLLAPDDESREKWRSSFHQHLLDQSTWGRRVCESSMELHGLDKSFIASPDFQDCFDSPSLGSPFGTLMRHNRRGSGGKSKEEQLQQQQLRKSPKLTPRANNLYDSVAISTPRVSSSSFSSSSSSASPRSNNGSVVHGASPRHRRTPSTSSSGSSSSKSTPTTLKASSAASTLTAFPSLDEEELDKLFLKYTSSSTSSTTGAAAGFTTSLTQSPSKRFNVLFPSMTLKPNRTTKKLPL